MNRAERLTLLVLALLSASPLWLSEHPPIQDWPQHLAALRVLHSYGDPSFDFERYFVLDVFRTQYLTVYAIGDLFAYLVGITSALKLVASIAIASLPFAVASFARAVDRSPLVAFLVLPLTYNAHLILGFLNFVLALPLMFLALTLAALEARSPRRHRPWLIAGVLVVCFYTHVVPFALGGVGAALLLVGDSWPLTLRRWIPLGFAASVAAPWLAYSPAGATLRGAAGIGAALEPTYLSVSQAIEQVPLWLTDVFRGDWDLHLLAAWSGLALVWLIGGLVTWWRAGRSLRFSRTLSLWALPVGCVIAYLFAPNGYSWIWPINTRFSLLAVLSLLPLAPSPSLRVQRSITLTGAVLTLVELLQVGRACRAFERELGQLERTLISIPPAQRVAGLIWARGSEVVEFSPYLHSVAYYQAERGGAVMFSFADFPQSPFRFRDDNRPPAVKPRWEWTPERVRPDRDLGWYDWVLTRGGPGAMATSKHFELLSEAAPWRVWRRREDADGPASERRRF